MTGEQIKLEIEQRNHQIRELLMPHFYTLNNGVDVILGEIRSLQAQCPHEWEDGFCIYCNLVKPTMEDDA
jgi:hypothetical protein